MTSDRACIHDGSRVGTSGMEFTDYLPMMLALVAAFVAIVALVVVVRRKKQP